MILWRLDAMDMGLYDMPMGLIVASSLSARRRLPMLSEKHEPISSMPSDGWILTRDGVTGITVRNNGGDDIDGPCILMVVE